MTEQFVDGNAAAGPLSEVFAFDVSSAQGQCAGCGQVAPMARSYVYGPAPGLVLRCSSCESVLMRMVSGGSRTWLDLTGLTYLQIGSA
jgi:Family of unknown function (DUF6510)